jgi:raffinose/stachyose/melibiose transport system permease protein
MSDATIRRTLSMTLKYLLLAVFTLVWVGVPSWLAFVTSMKTEGEAAELSLDLPTRWAGWENFRVVVEEGNYLTGLRNSLLVAVPTITVVLLFGAMAAWTYARTTSRAFQTFYVITSLSILLPPAVIPTIYVLSGVGLDGTTYGYALMMMGTKVGIVVFLTTGFLRALPVDLEEAAAIDGASRLRIFVAILLPLLRPVLFVGGVILVIAVWNDFFFGLLLLKTSANATLPLTLFSFASGSYSLRWNLVFAHVILTSLPLVVVYLIAQRHVLAGLTEGGLKG